MDRITEMHTWLAATKSGTANHHVNLLMIDLDPAAAFAGQRTALLTGVQIASAIQRPLRIFILKDPDKRGELDPGALDAWIRTQVPDFDQPTEVFHGPDLASVVTSSTDTWVCTHWMTAVVLEKFLKERDYATDRAIYLIQDFEPAFAPWGTSFALAENTYHYGFIPLVNSRPLAQYLTDKGHADFALAHCFSPTLDENKLMSAAANWRPAADANLRVLFYGRPAHPRNLFELGLDALRAWVHELPSSDLDRITFTSAGTPHEPIELGRGKVLHSLGKLSLGDYYELLAHSDIGFSLMHSPHPGHLSLEMPTAGIPTVTNSFGGYRQPWNPLLTVSAPEPTQLASALEHAKQIADRLTAHDFQPIDAGKLGPTLESSAAHVAQLAVGSGIRELGRDCETPGTTGDLLQEYRRIAALRAVRITVLRKELEATQKKLSQANKLPNNQTNSQSHEVVELKRQVKSLSQKLQLQRRQLWRYNKIKSLKSIQPLLPTFRRMVRLRRQVRTLLKKRV
ncbi:hypothetical protein PY310_17020 [Pseudarthrobacter sp. H3Y2-7]|uniref:rhamnosyltransferase WsaF family glycosyltransferase n=1 Tax=Pseudarthrobacter naphthalenicus TaxID=3031328 RepID=UPI0023AFBC9E|nr:hypothetical protein [Pseudarthrobacter sp. H3Y2-7]MDE8670282.1 hypothetical protein [Pseudarthrobacter sp. H3Y2-7]